MKEGKQPAAICGKRREAGAKSVRKGIFQVVEHDGSVEEIKDLLTMHLGSQDILLNLKIRFRHDLDTLTR